MYSTLINPFAFAKPPAQSDLYIWLDPSDLASMSYDSGTGAIASITCKATARVWAQSTEGRRPILTTDADYRHKVMSFIYGGGLSKAFTSDPAGSALSGFTVVWAGDNESAANSYNVFGLSVSTATNAIQGGSPGSYIFKSPSTTCALQTYISPGYNYSVNLSPGAFNTFAQTVPTNGSAASGAKFYHNNVEISRQGGTGNIGSTFNPIALGSYDTLYQSWGKCGEFLVYSRQLTVDELTAVHNYLHGRWKA